MKYIAVVVASNGAVSKRADGTWSCFVGPVKRDVISHAIKAADRWGRAYGNPTGPYDVLVGTLTDRVEAPINFKLVKLP